MFIHSLLGSVLDVFIPRGLKQVGGGVNCYFKLTILSESKTSPGASIMHVQIAGLTSEVLIGPTRSCV